MANGLKVWDASQALMLDLTTRVGRIIGEVTTTPNVAGSLNVPGFAEGQGFYILQPMQNEGPSGGSGKPVTGVVRPTVSINGTTLSWTEGTQCLIFFGVF